MSHSNESEWTDFGRVRFNNASLVHAVTSHFGADRQLTSAMGSHNNKVHVLGGNGRSSTVFTPWISQVEATSVASESGCYSQPTYSYGGEDPWPSFIVSPEQTDYRQAPVSVLESTPSTPLLYDTVTLGPIIDCSGVADLILDKVSTAHPFSKESRLSTCIILPPAVASMRDNFTAISSRLPLHTFGALKQASVATDSLLQVGKDNQVTTSNVLPGDVNWKVSDSDQVDHVLDHCANNEPRARNEQWKNAAIHEEYLRNYRKGRHPKAVTLQKSDHMRRERDRRIALKLMYKTLDSMIPRPSKKSKRDRTAIVDDALTYVKTLQEKLEKLRVKCVGVHKSPILRHRRLHPGHNNLKACSTFELPRCSGSQDQECIEEDSLSILEPNVNVFISCGNEVLINISCRPRAKLVSCVLEVLELLCLDVHQYSFSKLLEELVHCNFKAKQKEASEETPAAQMIEEVLKSLLK